MELQELDVYIDPDGQVRIEVRGVQGPACLLATADLEAVLGGAVTSRELTPEAAEGARVAITDVAPRQVEGGGSG